MTQLYENLKDIIMWVFTALIGIIVWFLKGFYSEFREIQRFYAKHKELDLNKLITEIESVKKEISKVESDSKRYWSEHKINMDNNQKIILEKLGHTHEMLTEKFINLEKRFDKLENDKQYISEMSKKNINMDKITLTSLKARIKAKTPIFWKKVRYIMVSLGTIGIALKTTIETNSMELDFIKADWYNLAILVGAIGTAMASLTAHPQIEQQETNDN